MEKTMSVEEKIRKAQEIYNRRNENSYYTYTNNKKEKKGPSLMSRMIRQIIVCFIIYGIFYVVSNREYFLSQEFKVKMDNIAAQDETINKAYNYVMKHIEKYFYQEENKIEQEQETMQENTIEEQSEDEDLQTNSENIGGAENIEATVATEKTQEEQDVEYIKNNISFAKPIEGTITSTFGWRNPTTATVPKYHTGLDIGAKKGTVIKSATDGTVVLASSEGDFRKPL